MNPRSSPSARRRGLLSVSRIVGIALVAVLAASSCGSPPTATAGANVTGAPVAGGAPAPGDATDPPTKVLVVVEENHSEAAALDGMPYLAGLANQYGHTSAYRAITHPSLPNYLAIAGGSTFGVTDDSAPEKHPITQTSVFDQAVAAGRTARTYAEAMPQPCALTSDGRYAVKHNPWAYFSAATSRANCQQFDVPAGTLEQGSFHDEVLAGALPTVGLLIPDLCNDGHDCALRVADNWLAQWLPFVMAGPDYQAGRLAIVVTFDEDDHSAGNTVLTTVIAPGVAQLRVSTPLNHYSLSGYLSKLAGAAPLAEAAGSRSFAQAFGI